MYCVSEITGGFKYDGPVNDQVWEKSLTLALCSAGASAVRTGAVILQLRFLIFMLKVAEALGLPPGKEITNPEVLAFLQNIFEKGYMPTESAAILRKEFPGSPWGGGAPAPDPVPGSFEL